MTRTEPAIPTMTSATEVRRPGIVRQSGLTTLAAGAAVVTGLLLDATIASHFGAGAATDAFFVAARIPLGVLAIVMVGANQALVPAFSTWLTNKGDGETNRLVSLVLVGTLLATSALAGLAAVAAYPLMRLSAPGLDPGDAALAASVARVMFALIPLVAVAEVLRAALNARFSFVGPAGMHAVMNAVAAGVVATFAGVDVHLIAWAYVLGASVQLAFLLAMAWRRGYRFVPTLAFRDADLRATGRLTVRPLLGASLNPVARLAEQLVVSFLPSGSITILNYGYRLISAIGGSVFFRSVMVVVLPRLTRARARGDEVETRRVTSIGVQMMLAISLPLTAFMAVLSAPFVRALFRRGSFSSADASLLGLVLAVYAASLVGSALQRALLAPFYAGLDTRTPLRNTFYGVVTNVALLGVAVLPFRHHQRVAVVGVAVAYSLAQYVNLAHAWLRVRGTVARPFAGTGALVFHVGVASVSSAVLMLVLAARLHLSGTLPATTLLLRGSLITVAGLAATAAVLGALPGSRDLRRTLRAAVAAR
ncbi:MAG TPA: lipid II flippase MurJ [Acidimicrobiia bacterium]